MIFYNSFTSCRVYARDRYPINLQTIWYIPLETNCEQVFEHHAVELFASETLRYDLHLVELLGHTQGYFWAGAAQYTAKNIFASIAVYQACKTLVVLLFLYSNYCALCKQRKTNDNVTTNKKPLFDKE